MQNKTLTLGSLFDGSGGFPLGGLLAGIEPVWASEIEPFPIRVTTKRLPFMKHYGDISQMDGGKIEPVDIITFGSPCQDMSVAGKRAGLDGSRSNLFHEAIRIVKEMRQKTNGKYPRYIVWENVPGAFSSNKGEDFKAVLEAVIGIVQPDTQVPMPEKNRWPYADCYMGDGWSVAYRVLDAQFWGVPQRRKRIYLVADFAGGSAGKILFESEGLSGYTPQGFRAWEETAGGATEGTGETGCYGVDGYNAAMDDVPLLLKIRCGCEGGGKGPLIQRDRSATLSCNNDQTLFEPKSLDCRNMAVNEDLSGTLQAKNNGGHSLNYTNPVAYGICSKDSNAMKSANPDSGFYEADTTRCLDANGGNPSCNQGGMAIVALEGNGSRPSHRGDGYSEEDVSYTLNATEHHAVAYGLDRAAFNQGRNALYDFAVEAELEPTMVAKGPGAVAQPTFSSSKLSSFTEATEETANYLVATDYKDPPLINAEDGADYIVRRLTPTECARLQGFPDWWCSDLATEHPTSEEVYEWYKVFETHRKIIGSPSKPKTEEQIRDFLRDPHSDSAEYKMWGNGVALPCVYFVLSGIVWADGSAAKSNTQEEAQIIREV